MTQNVRLQNLRDFTVQIRNASDEIVGTGIAVSTGGKIVTCAHVVETALKAHPRDVNGAEVGIYFPQIRGGEDKKYSAKVDCCFREHDDDMVLLQIIGGKSPLAPEQIAVLGMADQSEGNPFRTYGYSPIGNYPATRGDGIIQGSVEPPEGRKLQVDPIQLKSRDIAAGMSGAAVLDVTRNLIVGLVMERFYSAGAVQDDIGYGVDSKVLTFDPFDFVLRGEALELKPAPVFRLDKDLFKQAMDIANYMLAHRPTAEKYSWNSAPSVLAEWTGRDDLLAQITEDWNNPQKHVTGLIGFGGEGKSSLARKWVDNVIARRALSPTKQSPVDGETTGNKEIASQSALAMTSPDGVFWWGFYENRSIDEFLEAALNFLSGGRIDPRQVPSSSLRAQIIGAMLGAGRYLFVLDGLEVLQHQEGDQYGLLQSNDLRDLLTYFARPDNQSFCLITSRAPVLDLMEYTTYTHRDVDRLSEADGIALLEKLGVKPSPSGRGQGEGTLSKVVSDWDGHALTISLLGSYLAEKYNGDIVHLADIPIPTADEPRYERVHRVLRRYDEHLSKDEREFLKLFSVFRLPVKETAFEKVFEPLLNKTANTDSPIPESQITNIVTRLVNYRLIRLDEHEKSYTTHPLIRNHYFTLFTKGDSNQGKDAHLKIKDYYLSIAGDTPQYPTLDDLKPLIEVVHHACQAGEYDDAWKVLWERIYQQNNYVIAHQLGAYDTALGVLYEFFPDKDLSQEVLGSNPNGNKQWIPNSIGLCFMSLGRLREALPFYERGTKISLDMQYWENAGLVYQNLADLHAQLGALEASAEAARQALDLARKAEDIRGELASLSFLGNAANLSGNVDLANKSFEEAESLAMKASSRHFLWGNVGIYQIEHLRRINQIDYARRVAESNLELSQKSHWQNFVSQYHRVLGDLDLGTNNPESARAHYESALKIARSISERSSLIEALLARGRFYAKVAFQTSEVSKTSEVSQAFTDLNEALNYAVEGGYRIYEADIRVALAWAYLANGEKEKAKQSAQRALQMSQEMGYHWGKVDGEEVLERMKDE